VYTYQSDVSTVHKQGKLLHSLCKPWLKACVFVHITRTHLENVCLILSLTTNRRAPQKRVSKASCQQWVRRDRLVSQVGHKWASIRKPNSGNRKPLWYQLPNRDLQGRQQRLAQDVGQSPVQHYEVT